MNSPTKTAEPRVFADFLSQFFGLYFRLLAFQGCPGPQSPIIKIFIMGGREKGLEMAGNRGFNFVCLHFKTGVIGLR